MIRNICPKILSSHVSRSSLPAGVDVFRGGVIVVFCSPDSARGRFNEASDAALTGAVLLDGRDVSFAKGFSTPADDVEAGLIVILGLAGSATGVADFDGGVEVVTGTELSPSVLCSRFGFAGPESFSIRRRRIYISTSLVSCSSYLEIVSCLIHFLLIWSIRSSRGRLRIVIHDCGVKLWKRWKMAKVQTPVDQKLQPCESNWDL